MPNLKELYETKIIPAFSDQYKNRLAVPKVTKVLVGSGIGKLRDNKQMVEQIEKNLTLITGQKPALRRAKKAISGFKVREGDPVGLIVTLRGQKMYDFLDKLANVTLPRIRDFRGLDPDSFDQAGNFNLGVKEHIYFPEVSHQTENLHGLEVTIVTTAKNKEDGQKLLENLGFPFKK